MKGRRAQGLEPRGFCWIIKDRLAASERPGGFARNHRKVRRQEELIWLRVNGFTHIVSLLDSPHNLHAYDEANIAYVHVPLGTTEELPLRVVAIYSALDKLLERHDEKLYLHNEEFNDRVLGVLGGYLLHAGLVDNGPHAISIIEKLTSRSLDASGREVIAATLTF